MNRRDLFRGVLGASMALILPPSVAENVDEGRRWWALGGMPGRDSAAVFDSLLMGRAVPYQGSVIRIGQTYNPPMPARIRGGWFPVDGSGVEQVKRISLGEELTFWDNHDWVDYVVTEKVPGGVLLARNDV